MPFVELLRVHAEASELGGEPTAVLLMVYGKSSKAFLHVFFQRMLGFADWLIDGLFIVFAYSLLFYYKAILH